MLKLVLKLSNGHGMATHRKQLPKASQLTLVIMSKPTSLRLNGFVPSNRTLTVFQVIYRTIMVQDSSTALHI